MTFIFFCLGLIAGSFLNVVIIRKNTGRGMGGRSGCMHCAHQLAWNDLLPVISWLSLKGTCRYCGCSVSLQYPLVELSTALLFACFAAVPGVVPLWVTILWCLLSMVIIGIAVYDTRHTIIPDIWNVFFIGIALATAPYVWMYENMTILTLLFSGFIVGMPLGLLWFFSSGRAMGFGDVKFAVGIGFLLGPWYGLSALMLGFIIGGIVCAPLLLMQNKKVRYFFTHSRILHSVVAGVTMKSEVPFGPFLALGTLIVLIAVLYQLPVPPLWL